MPWQPAYATVEELKSFIADAATGSDTELTLAIETASRSVDRICNRQFGLADAVETRFYTASYEVIRRRTHPRWVIGIDDLQTVVGLVVEADTNGAFTPITDFLPTPVNAVVNGKPWTRLIINSSSPVSPNAAENGVRVTARFGWSAVPNAIKMATLIQASRLFARRHAPFGVTGNPDVGELRLLERLDVDLMTSVAPFVRHWGAV